MRAPVYAALAPDSTLEDGGLAASEPFRDRLTEAEMARRYPGRLSARWSERLDACGYPFVRDELRFRSFHPVSNPSGPSTAHQPAGTP